MSAPDREAGRLLFTVVKGTTPADGVCLGLATDDGVWLRPVGTSRGAASAEELRVLTQWRNRHVAVFLTEFVATEDRTASWLVSAVGQDAGRIVFTLREPNGAIFGLCGLASADWVAGTVELDGVIRGTAAVPGGMSVAIRVLLDWASRIGLPTALVRVVSDNDHALAFYRRLGFVETDRVALRRVEEPGMVTWVPDASRSTGGRALVYHRLAATASAPRGGT